MDGLTPAIEKMRRESLGEAAIETFRRAYERLRDGDARGLRSPRSKVTQEPVAGQA